VATVARIAKISRQAIYRTPKRRGRPRRGPAIGIVDEAIVTVAKANPTDGTRMVAAMASRELGRQVNRKRAQRVMREQRLLQRHRPLRRRRRPGFFRVERPDQLWHMDMTSVWVAEHGWCYLNAIIDCCTREIPAWCLDLRCRAQEAIAVVDRGVVRHHVEPAELTLGSDNGTAYTSRAFRAYLKDLGITHRRGGYRDPESQAFIESFFSKLKERVVWRNEFETLDEARAVIGHYIEEVYPNRPHSRLGYRTPLEVRQTWEDGRALVKTAA
jgi:putative transposase